jgi:hypothetical protein
MYFVGQEVNDADGAISSARLPKEISVPVWVESSRNQDFTLLSFALYYGQTAAACMAIRDGHLRPREEHSLSALLPTQLFQLYQPS